MNQAATLASGKTHADENFPVASRLVAPRHRAPIMAFYRFARAADDIADNPLASEPHKHAALEAMRASLAGESGAEPTAMALREVIVANALTPRHALDLLEAFRRDVVKRRYADWDELIDYCAVSAMPVGRFVLDVHGEAHTLWPASDALCAALQIINHLQDCAADYCTIDRVYLPQDMLAAAGASDGDLARDRATPELRSVIDALAARCQDLLREAAGFARAIRDRRLGVEVAVIHKLAVSLAARLRIRDPLSQRVHHARREALLLALSAAVPRLLRP